MLSDQRCDHRDRREGSDERIAAERRDRREEPRRPVRLTYLRDGKTKTATVTLGTRPS
jgi:S1-C subfamily serine protease